MVNGKTVCDAPDPRVFQLYVKAPEAVRTTESPRQMVVPDALIDVNGFGLIATVAVVDEVHPAALVPVTVYVVVPVGVTLCVEDVPRFVQTYDVALVAVKVMVEPVHIVAEDGVMATGGPLITVTVRVAVAVQPTELVAVTV